MRSLDLDGVGRVLVLGHGQLGSAITNAITQRFVVDQRSGVTDWSGPAAAARSVATNLGSLPETDLPVTVVWAAGRCGMSSTTAECRRSLDVMSAVLEEVQRVRPSCTHLLGSVGALALGHPRWSPSVSSASEVPYARLKRAEEDLVAALDLGDPVVHLVSSVYGPPDRPGRRGMITVLAVNAAQLRATRIFGRWATLRNYVHADDVGTFIAERIAQPAGPARHILAAHRSHSIAELVAAVGAARRRAVPVQLVSTENAEDLTIDPGAIAPSLRSRPVETAITQMILDLRHVAVA